MYLFTAADFIRRIAPCDFHFYFFLKKLNFWKTNNMAMGCACSQGFSCLFFLGSVSCCFKGLLSLSWSWRVGRHRQGAPATQWRVMGKKTPLPFSRDGCAAGGAGSSVTGGGKLSPVTALNVMPCYFWSRETKQPEGSRCCSSMDCEEQHGQGVRGGGALSRLLCAAWLPGSRWKRGYVLCNHPHNPPRPKHRWQGANSGIWREVPLRVGDALAASVLWFDPPGSVLAPVAIPCHFSSSSGLSAGSYTGSCKVHPSVPAAALGKWGPKSSSCCDGPQAASPTAPCWISNCPCSLGASASREGSSRWAALLAARCRGVNGCASPYCGGEVPRKTCKCKTSSPAALLCAEAVLLITPETCL